MRLSTSESGVLKACLDYLHARGVLGNEIEGFPGYVVGDDGSVWSCRPGLAKGALNPKWRRLKPSLAGRGTGHFRVCLRGEKDVSRYIHRLVLTAFRGPCPPGMQACHNDGNGHNNVLGNLRWDTQISNARDALRDGQLGIGEKHPGAVLNENQVVEIKKLIRDGSRPCNIARLFCVSVASIYLIKYGRTWRHVV